MKPWRDCTRHNNIVMTRWRWCNSTNVIKRCFMAPRILNLFDNFSKKARKINASGIKEWSNIPLFTLVCLMNFHNSHYFLINSAKMSIARCDDPITMVLRWSHNCSHLFRLNYWDYFNINPTSKWHGMDKLLSDLRYFSLNIILQILTQ